MSLLDRLKRRKPDEPSRPATIAAVDAALSRLLDERTRLKQEVTTGAEKRRDLLGREAFDDIIAHDAEMARTVLRIEALDQAERDLLAELRALQAVRRQERIAHHRGEARKAFETLAQALTAAYEANEAATRVHQSAIADLGGSDAARFVPRVNYPPPGVVIRDMVDHWTVTVRGELNVPVRPDNETASRTIATTTPVVIGAGDADRHARETPPTVTTEIVITAPEGYRNDQFDHWPAGSRKRVPVGWARRLVDEGKACYANGAAAASTASTAPMRKRRPLPSGPVPAGMTRVVVTRDGYSPQDDRPALLNGDIVDLPEETARAAIVNGAVDVAPADTSEARS